MINDALVSTLSATETALNTFLETMLGAPVGVHLEEPVPINQADVQAHGHVAIVSLEAAVPFAAFLEPSWVALLAETMLGEPLSVEDSSAKGLVREIAHQGYDAVRDALAQAGVDLEPASLDVRKPGGALPDFAGPLRRVPFSMAHQEQTLNGFAVFSASSPVPPETLADTDAAPAPKPSATIARADFPNLGTESIGGDGDTNLAMLAEVELEVTVELGRRKLPLADLLRLSKGSVFELEKLVGEPLEVYANGRLIAEGEAVVVDEQFGVRITNLTARS